MKDDSFIGRKFREIIFAGGKEPERSVCDVRQILGLRMGVKKSEYNSIEKELRELNIVERTPGGRRIRDPLAGMLP
jgi:hypothetical protein